MSIKDQIMADVKEAMKARDQERLSTLRFIHAAIKNREIELRPNEITDDETIKVVKKIAKQRKDSIEQFDKAGRDDLANKERSELAIVETYLPEQMGADQVASIVEEVIIALGATSMKQMGAVMKEVQAKTAGSADGKMVSDLVKSKLQ